MLLLQYSRQATYLHCKLENISVTRNCDCEKIMVDNTQGTHESEAPHFLMPVGPDEFFTTVQFNLELNTQPILIVKPFEFPQHFSRQEYFPPAIQPPIFKSAFS